MVQSIIAIEFPQANTPCLTKSASFGLQKEPPPAFQSIKVKPVFRQKMKFTDTIRNEFPVCQFPGR